MRLGQKVVRRPETFNGSDTDLKEKFRTLSGKVVYIHPEGRYHTVEFELPGGKARESFLGTEE